MPTESATVCCPRAMLGAPMATPKAAAATTRLLANTGPRGETVNRDTRPRAHEGIGIAPRNGIEGVSCAGIPQLRHELDHRESHNRLRLGRKRRENLRGELRVARSPVDGIEHGETDVGTRIAPEHCGECRGDARIVTK